MAIHAPWLLCYQWHLTSVQGVAVWRVVPELDVGVDVCPRGDAGEKGFAGGDFWRTNVSKGGAGMSVQGRECDIVKVDKTYI